MWSMLEPFSRRRRPLCRSTMIYWSAADIGAMDLRLRRIGEIATMSSSVVTLFDLSVSASTASAFTWRRATMVRTNRVHLPILLQSNDEYSGAVAFWSLKTFCHLRVRVSEGSAHQVLASDLYNVDTLDQTRHVEGGLHDWRATMTQFSHISGNQHCAPLWHPCGINGWIIMGTESYCCKIILKKIKCQLRLALSLAFVFACRFFACCQLSTEMEL